MVAFFWRRGANLGNNGPLSARAHDPWVGCLGRLSRDTGDVQPNCPKNTFDVQIHHFRKRFIRMRVKLLPPRRTRIGEQDIHMVRRLAHFRHQTLDIRDLGAVGGNRDGNSARNFRWESVQGFAGGFACRRFTGCDVDFGTAGLEETGRFGLAMVLDSRAPGRSRGSSPLRRRGMRDRKRGRTRMRHADLVLLSPR
jgi:hypothetical protein